MQSFASKILCGAMKAVFHSPLVNKSTMSDSAGKITKDKKSHYKPSKAFTLTRHRCGECFYEKLICKKCKTQKIILLFHGGSFKIKLIDTYRRLAEKYSLLSDGATVINVDYRTFPMHHFPSQLEDAVFVYCELLSQGIKSENIILIGDSAGANLALALPLYLRDNNIPMPSRIVSISLWGDLTAESPLREKNAYADPIYGLPKYKKIKDNLPYLHRPSSYARTVKDKKNPYASPCFGSFENFPPTTLICGGAELDEGDSDTVFFKMKEKNVDVFYYKAQGMFHDFPLVSFLPESKKAFKIIAERIK